MIAFPDPPPTTKDLCPPWKVYAAHIASGMTRADARQLVGWTASTERSQGRGAHVELEINRLRLEAYQAITDKLRAAMPRALDKLVEQIDSDDERVAQRAAATLINQHVKLSDAAIQALRDAVNAEERQQMIGMFLSQALGGNDAQGTLESYMTGVLSALQTKLAERFGAESVREAFESTAIEAQERAILNVHAEQKQ